MLKFTRFQGEHVKVKFNESTESPRTWTIKSAADGLSPPPGGRISLTYLTWEQLDAAGIAWVDLDNLQFTWEEFETWNPS
jgi:hypothetical protein